MPYKAILTLCGWFLLLTGCSLSTSLGIRCTGQCEVEFERNIDTKEPAAENTLPQKLLSSQ